MIQISDQMDVCSCVCETDKDRMWWWIVRYLFKPNTTIHKLQLCVRSALTKIKSSNATTHDEMKWNKTKATHTHTHMQYSLA